MMIISVLVIIGLVFIIGIIILIMSCCIISDESEEAYENTKLFMEAYEKTKSDIIELSSFKGGDNEDIPIHTHVIEKLFHILANCKIDKIMIPDIRPMPLGVGAYAEWYAVNLYLELTIDDEEMILYIEDGKSLSCASLTSKDIDDLYVVVNLLLNKKE